MINSHTWLIRNLFTQTIGDQSGVVVKVAWTLVSRDSQTPANEVNTPGVTTLGPPGNPFTPFPDLTETQVIGWVQAAMSPDGVAAAQSVNDAVIANEEAAAITTSQSPPWTLG